MDASAEVVCEIADRVATLTLDRGARHNALTLGMLERIDGFLSEVEGRRDVRVLVIRSSSARFFSSGADIKEWGDLDPEQMGSRFIRAGNRVFRRIEELDIPSVAVLSASALGGGLELALACDLRYATRSARLGFPEASVGAIPGWLGCRRVIDLVGSAHARQLVLLGDSIDGDLAAQWGLVNEALPAHELQSRVEAVVATLRSRSRTSLSVGKRLLRLVETGQSEIAHEFAASVCKSSPDALEGVAAFREKRHAVFK